MIRKVKSSVIKVERWLYSLKALINSEKKHPVDIDWYNRLFAWRHGFLSRSFVLYSLDKNDIGDYLSDYARQTKTPYINKEYSIILDNKLIFHEVMSKFNNILPKYYGLIQKGRIRQLDNQIKCSNFNDILELCKNNIGLILKPISGGGGDGVIILKYDSNRISIHGKEKTLVNIYGLIKNLDNYLIVEYIKQAGYSSKIYPKTTNTIRILTMWDYETNEPFIAAAIHRFGTEKSFPVDNCDHGGLSFHIDLDTGELGLGVCFISYNNSKNESMWLKNHPDTGIPVTGTRIPGWSFLKKKIIEMAGVLLYVPYIGWDIIMQESSFKIIEGNNYSAVYPLQVHRPLLKNPRIRRFYEAHRVI